MNNERNRQIYRLWALVYDLCFSRMFDRPRRRAVACWAASSAPWGPIPTAA